VKIGLDFDTTLEPLSFPTEATLLAKAGDLDSMGNENEMYVVEEREEKRKENIGEKIG